MSRFSTIVDLELEEAKRRIAELTYKAPFYQECKFTATEPVDISVPFLTPNITLPRRAAIEAGWDPHANAIRINAWAEGEKTLQYGYYLEPVYRDEDLAYVLSKMHETFIRALYDWLKKNREEK